MNRSDVAARLRNARPSKLRVVLNDDTEKGVAMPRGRNRWDKAAGIIDALPWTTVYLLDGKSEVCAEPIHRDDATPATEIEELPKNPTMAIVHTVMSHFAPVLRDVHKTATTSAAELVAKVRSVHKDEMQSILVAYAGIVERLTERAAGFEQRSNDLLAENDELREELVELRAKQGPQPSDMREAALVKAITGVDIMPHPGNTNAPEGGGANGANGVG